MHKSDRLNNIEPNRSSKGIAPSKLINAKEQDKPDRLKKKRKTNKDSKGLFVQQTNMEHHHTTDK